MKFFHLADLHLGKKVNGFSMIEDQRNILRRILELADEREPDGILIAGDVYDKQVPSAEAVDLFDEFLVQLVKRRKQVFVISGNHDSANRVSFGGRIMEQSGVHLAPVFSGKIDPIIVKDAFGPLYIWLIPFLRPAMVGAYYKEEEIRTSQDAMKTVLAHSAIDGTARNLAVAHQFVCGTEGELETCDSEDLRVGGLDEVSSSLFDSFDYVALGHLHGPQKVGRETVRYAGSPLKYSFSEEKQRKSVPEIVMNAKGEVEIHLLPLQAERDFRTVRGTFAEVTDAKRLAHEKHDDYMRIILTDEEDVPDAVGRLRKVYPNLMILDYDNTRTRTESEIQTEESAGRQDPMEVLNDLYTQQNGREMNDFQRETAERLIREIWEGES